MTFSCLEGFEDNGLLEAPAFARDAEVGRSSMGAVRETYWRTLQTTRSCGYTSAVNTGRTGIRSGRCQDTVKGTWPARWGRNTWYTAEAWNSCKTRLDGVRRSVPVVVRLRTRELCGRLPANRKTYWTNIRLISIRKPGVMLVLCARFWCTTCRHAAELTGVNWWIAVRRLCETFRELYDAPKTPAGLQRRRWLRRVRMLTIWLYSSTIWWLQYSIYFCM